MSGGFLVPMRSMFSVANEKAITANEIRENVLGIRSRIRVMNLTRRPEGIMMAKMRVFEGLLSRTRTKSGVKTLVENMREGRVREKRIVTGPKAIGPRAGFVTRMCILGGRRNKERAPFFSKCEPRFCFEAASIAKTYGLPSNVRVIVPKSGMAVAIRLVGSVTVRRKLEFTVERNKEAMTSKIITSVIRWSSLDKLVGERGREDCTPLFLA